MSSEPKSLKSSMRSSNLGGILGKLRLIVNKDSMRSSHSWGGGGGILGKLRTEVPKSSMRSSISGEGLSILCQEQGILCDFDNIFIPLNLAPASQIVSHMIGYFFARLI